MVQQRCTKYVAACSAVSLIHGLKFGLLAHLGIQGFACVAPGGKKPATQLHLHECDNSPTSGHALLNMHVCAPPLLVLRQRRMYSLYDYQLVAGIRLQCKHNGHTTVCYNATDTLTASAV